MLTIAACNQAMPSNSPQPVQSKRPEAAPSIPPPGTGPDAKTPLGKPDSAVDPKNPEAAQRLVQQFADLLDARKFDKARQFLRLNVQPPSELIDAFAQYSDLSVKVGDAGDQEGAAGSSYVSVPLTISGSINGKRVMRRANVVLRRVNDVPGSTEAQRRWHIERIDWADTGSLVN